jgi:penicillin-binding protein 1B
MDRQAIVTRARETFAKLRAGLTFRRVLKLTLIISAVGFLLIGTEALVRARLGSPRDRMPTALYTRPVPWGRDGESRPAIAIGTLEGGPLERRIPTELADFPEYLVQAVLAVEDQRFYRHHGIDIRRIGGALVANVKAGGIAQGGSTITQQLAKNLYLSASRTPLRKLREAAMALVLELRHDKGTILEAYLNEIYLGQDGDRAIHGMGAAARYYFGKDVRRLGLAESALLVGMISAPNRYAPTHNADLARERRDLVLQLMAAQGRISQAQAERAGRAEIVERSWPSGSLDGRYFRDFVLSAVPAGVPGRGRAVYTTLDAALQRAAERAVRGGLDRLPMRGAEAALVAIDPRTGEVLAMVGGRDYRASQFNRAVDARRQPGSAFKPIVALAALARQDGHEPAFTLASIIDDEPLRVKTPQGPWQPTNYDGEFHGPVTFRHAMEESLNVPFARIGLAVGPARIAETAKRLGITSPLHAVPSLALGSSEVSLLELVRAYGVLAAGGDLAEPRTVLGQGRSGARFEDTVSARVARVVEPAVAYLVTSTLEGVVSHGTGRALNEDGQFQAVAGKTGTSNDWRDAWFIAYSPTLVVGVWVGFDDGRSLGLTGAGAALPIVSGFMGEAAQDVDWGSFEVPEGITEGRVTLADASGYADCGSQEYFLEGTEPAEESCESPMFRGWDPPRDWAREFKRGARRFLEELLQERQDRRRSER